MRVLGAAAAALVVAATSVLGTGLAASPAQAESCSGAGGVTVVVDFNQLGGGVAVACDADGGGKTASSIFPESGFALRYATREPGFVCRVEEKPAQAPCATTSPADAYWSLYWSDGKSGSWNYATAGAGGQTVPDGGYVAFSWQGQAAKSPPSYDPAPRTAEPEGPPGGDTGGNGGSPGSGNGTADPGDQATPTPGSGTSASPDATDGPSEGAGGKRAKGSPDGKSDDRKVDGKVDGKGDGKGDKDAKKKERSDGAEADETSTDSGPTTVAGSDEGEADAPDATGSSQVPWWVVGLVFVGVAGALGVVAVRRRRLGT